MNNLPYGRTILVSLLCALIVAACGSFLMEGVSFSAAFVFSLIILWLCHETWYWLVSLPIIIAAIIGEARKKPLAEKTGAKFIRLGSLSLLVTPHLLFTILYILNKLTQEQASEALGIPLAQPYFITAFMAVALLWVLNLLMALVPLSVGAVFSLIFEPEEFTETARPADVKPLSPEAALPAVPAATETEALPEGILYRGKPVLHITPPHVRGSFRTGLFMLPFVLLGFGMAGGLLEHSLLAAVVCGGVALVFAFCAVHFLRCPSLWRKRLEQVEYAFSREEVIITEKGEDRRFPLNEGLNLNLEKLEGTVGNIYIAPTGKLGRAIKGFLGKAKIEVVDTSNHVDINAPLMGFFQIENAMEVFRLLVSCRDGNGQN